MIGQKLMTKAKVISKVLGACKTVNLQASFAIYCLVAFFFSCNSVYFVSTYENKYWKEG